MFENALTFSVQIVSVKTRTLFRQRDRRTNWPDERFGFQIRFLYLQIPFSYSCKLFSAFLN